MLGTNMSESEFKVPKPRTLGILILLVLIVLILWGTFDRPEKRFVQWVNHSFDEKSMLTEQQESILEGVYREKTGFIRHAILSMLG